MAMDAAMLELAPKIQKPILRFYSWSEPAATFGYFQKYEEILNWTDLRPLYRRPTGGGLVPHDADWTYSIAIPPSHPWYQLRATESYERLHRWIQQSFTSLGAAVELVEDPALEGPGRCFIGAERHDLLWRGLKMAGAAQRRNRLGLLIQGSIQNQPEGINRSEWERSILETGSQNWGGEWISINAESDNYKKLKSKADELRSSKYGSDSFIQKR